MCFSDDHFVVLILVYTTNLLYNSVKVDTTDSCVTLCMAVLTFTNYCTVGRETCGVTVR